MHALRRAVVPTELLMVAVGALAPADVMLLLVLADDESAVVGDEYGVGLLARDGHGERLGSARDEVAELRANRARAPGVVQLRADPNPAAGARGAASTSTASSSREASSTSASFFVEKTPSQETRASERVALASLMALTVGFR